ncbi:MAG: AAA family ATPase, partial [Planctomicrobium sp.]|nr:AAA family ATPase [Planctomicrobium sp.]
MTTEQNSAITKLNKAHRDIREQMAKVIVGQEDVIDQLLIALFSRGHCLLEGVPGLAKTLMINSLAQCLSMSF